MFLFGFRYSSDLDRLDPCIVDPVRENLALRVLQEIVPGSSDAEMFL